MLNLIPEFGVELGLDSVINYFIKMKMEFANELGSIYIPLNNNPNKARSCLRSSICKRNFWQ